MLDLMDLMIDGEKVFPDFVLIVLAGWKISDVRLHHYGTLERFLMGGVPEFKLGLKPKCKYPMRHWEGRVISNREPSNC